jgi:hypothetical protein
MRQRGIIALGILVSTLALCGSAAAQDRDSGPPEQVVLTGHLDVADGETVGDVVVVNGPVTIDGTVDGDLVVINGRLAIAGTVDGDVFHVRGGFRIEAGARIAGDVVSRVAPTISSDAVVEGDVSRFGPDMFGISIFAARLAVWVAVTASTLILGLLFLLLGPRAAEAAGLVGRTRVGPAIGWGFLLFLGLPIVAVIALITLVGIPFGVGLLLALLAVYSLAYVATAFVLGRALVRLPRSRLAAFFAGWGILRALALVPVLGGIAWTLSTVFGLGVLLVAAWRARRPLEHEPGATAAAAPAV